MDLSFRKFVLESSSFPQRPTSSFGNKSPETLDHTSTINQEFGTSDSDQAKVSPYVGSAVQSGSALFAGLPAFEVVSMNDKTVTLRIRNYDKKVIQRNSGKEDKKDPNPEEQDGKIVTIPRWQYERLITRGLDQQGGGAAPPPMI